MRINATELAWLGYERAEIIGRKLFDLLTHPSQEVFRKNFPILKERGELRDVEIELVRKDGTVLTCW